MAVVHVRHALSSMQLQKVVGIDPSMWPYRVHVRHALSSMQLQKVVGIDPSMWPYRVHVHVR